MNHKFNSKIVTTTLSALEHTKNSVIFAILLFREKNTRRAFWLRFLSSPKNPQCNNQQNHSHQDGDHDFWEQKQFDDRFGEAPRRMIRKICSGYRKVDV